MSDERHQERVDAVLDRATKFIRDRLVLGSPGDGVQGLAPDVVDARMPLLRDACHELIGKNERGMLLHAAELFGRQARELVNQANELLDGGQNPMRLELRAFNVVERAAEAAARQPTPEAPSS